MDKKSKTASKTSDITSSFAGNTLEGFRPLSYPVAIQEDSQHLVKKHVGAIQILNDISLQSRKLWNLLLKNARINLETQEEHEITLAEIKAYMGWKNNNTKDLIDLLTSLSTTPLRWGILDEETMHKLEELGVSTLLAGATYRNGVISYSYYKKLRPLLANPDVYGIINITVSNKLKTKAGLALYENAVVYIDPSTGKGTSELIETSRLYDILGVSHEREMRDVKRNVILPALKDVNAHANVVLEAIEERAGRGRGGQIRGIRLSVELKGPQQNKTDDLLATIDRELVEEMMAIGVTEGVAYEFAACYPATGLREKIEYTKEKVKLQERIKGNEITNPAGFFSTAVRGKWNTSRKQEELQLDEVALNKPSKKGKIAAVEEREAPEWVWFQNLSSDDQNSLITSFINTHTLSEVQLQKLSNNGPRDSYVIVPFSHHLRSKRNQKSKSLLG